MTGTRWRQRAQWMPSRGTTSARRALPTCRERQRRLGLRGVMKWIVDHVKKKHRNTPPKGPRLRKELRHERKALAGHYQLLSGHVATGDYLCNKIYKLAPDRCWWCGQDEKQTRHHFANCAAWKPQIKELWKDVGYLCGWMRACIPGRPEWPCSSGMKATKAVLSFLRKTKVGQMVTIPPRDWGREGEKGGEDGSRVERDEVEGEERGPGPPARLFERERSGVGRLQGGM